MEWIMKYIMPTFIVLLLGFASILMISVGKQIIENGFDFKTSCSCTIEKVGKENKE